MLSRSAMIAVIAGIAIATAIAGILIATSGSITSTTSTPTGQDNQTSTSGGKKITIGLSENLGLKEKS